MTSPRPQTVILCGGKGTRLRELTEALPKALVEIGGRPIVWHIMSTYAAHGFADFILASGHLGDQLTARFAGTADPWRVQIVDTGAETNTGGRIKQLEQVVRGDTFFATYGDGLADIDFEDLLAFHNAHGRIATVTAVRPRLSFGLVSLDADGIVTDFTEKPLLDQWVSGGFFVFDRRIFDYLDSDSVLEEAPLRALAAASELVAYRHQGFWRCMDTYKDHAELNQLWQSGAPWARARARR
jgi:glucose-1-phosphate cytidylyltransferase